MFNFALVLKSISRRPGPLLLILFFALCTNNIVLVHAGPQDSILPDSVLRHLLYTEPNLHVLQLGNVR